MTVINFDDGELRLAVKDHKQRQLCGVTSHSALYGNNRKEKKHPRARINAFRAMYIYTPRLDREIEVHARQFDIPQKTRSTLRPSGCGKTAYRIVEVCNATSCKFTGTVGPN